MKRNFKLFCTMCLAGTMAFATSCKKNEEKQAIQVTLPPFEEVMGEPGEEDSKAYIDFNDGQFYWNADDEVLLYNIDNKGTNTQRSIWATDASAEGQAKTSFDWKSGQQIGDKLDHYFVFYPSSRVDMNTPLGAQNRETFSILADQTYTLDLNGNPTVDPESMALAVEVWRLNAPFTLNHIFGICRLRLCGDGQVTKIELIDNVKHLRGTAKMKLHEVNMETFRSLMNQYTLVADGQADMNPSFLTAWQEYKTTLGFSATSTDDEEGRTVTLNCPNVQLNGSTPTPFYISVRPGAFIQGFTIKVYTVNNPGGYEILNYNAPKNSYCIKAGTITGFRPKTSGADILIH